MACVVGLWCCCVLNSSICRCVVVGVDVVLWLRCVSWCCCCVLNSCRFADVLLVALWALVLMSAMLSLLALSVFALIVEQVVAQFLKTIKMRQLYIGIANFNVSYTRVVVLLSFR